MGGARAALSDELVMQVRVCSLYHDHRGSHKKGGDESSEIGVPLGLSLITFWLL